MNIYKEVYPKTFKFIRLSKEHQNEVFEPKYRMIEFVLIPYFRINVMANTLKSKIEKILFFDGSELDVNIRTTEEVVCFILNHYHIKAYNRINKKDILDAYVERQKFIVWARPNSKKICYEIDYDDIFRYGLSQFSFCEVESFTQSLTSSNKRLIESYSFYKDNNYGK